MWWYDNDNNDDDYDEFSVGLYVRAAVSRVNCKHAEFLSLWKLTFYECFLVFAVSVSK